MIGMALAIGLVPPLKSDNLRQLTGIVGLAMICLGTLFYTAETPFPGFAALTPCLGAALLIHSGCQGDTISSKLLGARPVVFIGKLSYALYLWHWPLLAFATYELGEGLSFFQKVTLLIAAFVLSILTYYFVEQPIRRKGNPYDTLFGLCSRNDIILFLRNLRCDRPCYPWGAAKAIAGSKQGRPPSPGDFGQEHSMCGKIFAWRMSDW